MPGPSNLEDPDYAAFAWRRYWMLMRWMTGFTSICVILVVGVLYWLHGPVSIHYYIATATGVAAVVLLTAALMGLVFLSSGTGHDDAVEDHRDREHWPDE